MKKRKDWTLIFSFLMIAVGLILSFTPYLLGGYSVENMQNHINFFIFGFIILAGIGLIFIGVIISVVLLIRRYIKKIK